MFDSKAVADQLVTLLSGVTGVNLARKGVPESQSVFLEADVTLGGHTVGRKAQGVTYRDQRYLVTLSYRLAGAESTAEDALMVAVDDLIQQLHDDLTLAGTCQGVEIDASAADSPDYQPRAGREYREYPVTNIARQYGTYEPNP